MPGGGIFPFCGPCRETTAGKARPGGGSIGGGGGGGSRRGAAGGAAARGAGPGSEGAGGGPTAWRRGERGTGKSSPGTIRGPASLPLPAGPGPPAGGGAGSR